jgi:hypothetical protein
MSDEATRALDALGGGDRVVRDRRGPAVYRLSPLPAMTAVLCLACSYVGLVPSIPRVPALLWTCSRCGRTVALEPPPAVWLQGSA